MTDNISVRRMRPDDSQALMALEDETALLVIAEERCGPDCVIFAGIQAGNEASLRANLKWANQLIRDRERFAIPVLRDDSVFYFNTMMTLAPCHNHEVARFANRYP